MAGPISIIVAVNQVGTIGDKQGIPWYIPADMQRFRQLTVGGVVIMGRKTWESLPSNVRPLPGRVNVVITGQTDYVADGAEIYHDLQQALAKHRSSGRDIWIIGGASIYKEAAPYCEFAFVTEVHSTKEGDTKLFPIDGELVSIACESQEEPDGTILRFDFKKIRIRH